MSESNQVRVVTARETVYNETPPEGTEWRTQRLTGSTLGITPNTVESQELRADRMTADQILTSYTTGGESPIELSARTFDEDIEGAMQQAAGWQPVTPAAIASPADTIVAGTGQTITSATSDFVALGFLAGHVVRTTGFATAVNNGDFVIDTVATTVLTIAAGSGLVDEGPTSAQLEQSTGRKSLSTAMGTATVSAAASTITEPAVDFVTAGYQPGMTVTTTGFADPANNVTARLKSVTTTVLTFMAVAFADEGPVAANVAFNSSFSEDTLSPGTDTVSFAQQISYLDVPAHVLLNGQVVNVWALNWEFNQVLTGQFAYAGASGNAASARRADDMIIAAAGQTLTSASSDFSLFEIGQWVNLSGFSDAANNGAFKLANVATTVLTFEGSSGLVDEGPTSGVADRVFVPPADIQAASTTQVLNASSDVPDLIFDGVVRDDVTVQQIAMELNNNLRAEEGIGSPTPRAQLKGRAQVQGTIRIYLAAGSFFLFEASLRQTPIAIEFSVYDANGEGYRFRFPRVKITAPTPPAPGVDQDTFVEGTWMALLDSTLGSNMEVMRQYNSIPK